MLSDVGSTDDTALLCHTNRLPPPGSNNSGGDWLLPTGERVVRNEAPGVMRHRAPMVVKLKRNSGTPLEGMYTCSIEDDTSTSYKIFVGLYHSGGGIFLKLVCNLDNVALLTY